MVINQIKLAKIDMVIKQIKLAQNLRLKKIYNNY